MKVLVVDDHMIVRLGIKLMLEKKFVAITVFEAGDFALAKSLMLEQIFDLIILDVHLDEFVSANDLRLLLIKQPLLKIVMLSQMPEEVFGIHYLRAGAKAYISKTNPNLIIEAALEIVVNNRMYIAPSLALQMQTLALNPTQHSTDLSDRETEVMSLWISGKSTSEIALSIGLQLSTISTYKARILDKLKVSNIMELRDIALVLGIATRKGGNGKVKNYSN